MTKLTEDIELLQGFVSDRSKFGGQTIDDAITNVCAQAKAYAELPDMIEGMRVPEREIELDNKAEYLLRGLIKGSNTALDLILTALKEPRQIK